MLQDDLEQRKKDAQLEVEVFRIVHGRLPNQPGDRFTKKTAKTFLDMLHEGKTDKKYWYLSSFAFNAFASTNKAYDND